MFFKKYHRKLKTLFPVREERLIDSLFHRGLVGAIILFVLFLGVQLALNALLVPKGVELEKLNNEKRTLIEDNRNISQEIARIKSVSIIREIAGEEIDLEYRAEKAQIRVANESIIAEL